MVIILIGNYSKDQQESMLRFSSMLQTGFTLAGYSCLVWRANTIFGHLTKSTQSGFGKWLGYIDKFILYPIILKSKILFYDKEEVVFHICDHSNSIYLPYFVNRNISITCHDVLAIRGSLGFEDSYCQSSKVGKFFQQWILRNLRKAQKIISISEFTLKQLNELCASTEILKRKVIYQGFNANFSVLSKDEIDKRLDSFQLVNKRFLLCVGSSHQRKNRVMLLKMVFELGVSWDGVICFAGEKLDDKLTNIAIELNLLHRIISIVSPTHETLVALYNGCEAFIFPSYSEGFGMPLIEAQACGAPVIASSIQPMPETSGGAAIHIFPDDSKGFANAILLLQNEDYRNELIANGYKNIKRYDVKSMAINYLTFFVEN